MSNILDQLGAGEGLPVDAMRAADADRAAMVPLFLQAIERCAGAGPSMRNALFIVFHLLGQWRERSAYRPLAAFLRRPHEEIKSILGDATTETSHRVMAAVFDGDPNPLYEVILDPQVDEFVRSRMFDALVIVASRGELPREEAARFLRSCHSDIQPQDECFVWQGWQSAVAMLGLSDLEPLVEQAFARGFISPSWLEFKHFKEDLHRALGEDGLPAWRRDEYEPFGDAIEELSRWAGFAPGRKGTDAAVGGRHDSWSMGAPAVNGFRDVGRNDPCPCGSGRKFKKCCLGKSTADLPGIDLTS